MGCKNGCCAFGCLWLLCAFHRGRAGADLLAGKRLQTCHKCGAGFVYYNGGGAADWAGIAAELAPASDSSSVSDSEVGAYRRTLTDEAAAQALRDVLAASGIEAAIASKDSGWQVTLVHAADGQKAEALLAANCGTIPYEITAGRTAP